MKTGLRILQTAHERVRQRQPSLEFASFVESFREQVESRGLAQAVATARARGFRHYLDDLAAVLGAMGHDEAASADRLQQASLASSVTDYVRLSWNAVQAARYLSQCMKTGEGTHAASRA